MENRNLTFVVTLAVAVVIGFGCTPAREPANDDGDPQPVNEVRRVLEMQQAGWNRGDIDGFMDGYDRSEMTTFVSGDEMTRGWQTVLDRYKQHYKSREDMGTLAFSDLDIKPAAPALIIADGRWQLARKSDSPHGRFTLVFHKTGSGWRIIHDTTASAAN